MARTALTLQTPTRAGLSPSFATAIVDGHSFPNNGRTILRFKNTGEEATVTVRFGGSIDGIANTGGRDIVLPATTGDVTTAVWPKDEYDQGDGSVWIDYDGTPTGISVAALVV